MRSLLFALLVLPATLPAASVIHEVTPESKVVGGFMFEIMSTKENRDSVLFKVVVTPKKAKFSKDSNTTLSSVKIAGNTRTIEGVRAVPHHKKGKSLACSFRVTNAKLKDPNFSFVFTNYVETVINGKVVPMPSADFFAVRLQQFLPK